MEVCDRHVAIGKGVSNTDSLCKKTSNTTDKNRHLISNQRFLLIINLVHPNYNFFYFPVQNFNDAAVSWTSAGLYFSLRNWKVWTIAAIWNCCRKNDKLNSRYTNGLPTFLCLWSGLERCVCFLMSAVVFERSQYSYEWQIWTFTLALEDFSLMCGVQH